jgi:hypothetical protein
VDAPRRKPSKARSRPAGGAPAVRVYLQYLPDLAESSPQARREALARRFREAAAGQPIQLDDASLSETGQVIEALVPAERFDETVKQLAAPKDLQIDVVRSYQMNDG